MIIDQVQEPIYAAGTTLGAALVQHYCSDAHAVRLWCDLNSAACSSAPSRLTLSTLGTLCCEDGPDCPRDVDGVDADVDPARAVDLVWLHSEPSLLFIPSSSVHEPSAWSSLDDGEPPFTPESYEALQLSFGADQSPPPSTNGKRKARQVVRPVKRGQPDFEPEHGSSSESPRPESYIV